MIKIKAMMIMSEPTTLGPQTMGRNWRREEGWPTGMKDPQLMTLMTQETSLTQSQLEVPTLDHQEMIKGGRETTEEPKQGDPAWQLREKGPDLKRRGGEDHCPGPEEHHPQAAKEDEEIDFTIVGTETTVTKSISRKGGGAAGTRRRDKKGGSENH